MDTNILLYAVSSDPAEAAKARRARVLLLAGRWCWSAQVAAEFMRAGTAARKSHPLSSAEARQWLQSWSAFALCSIDLALVL